MGKVPIAGVGPLPYSGFEGMMRTTGEISSSGALRAGDHACWTFSDDEDHGRTLTDFFRGGLERGERLAYFAPEDLRSRLPGRMGEENTWELISSGRLVLLEAEDAYRPGADFDPTPFLETWEALARETVDAGYRGLSTAGEAGWLLGELGPGYQFSRYEFRADLLASSLPLTALCCYDARLLDAGAISIAQALHPIVLGPGTPGAGFTMTSGGDGRVAIAGEVDSLHADRVGKLLEDSAGRIHALDVSGLNFVDVAALRALARAASAMRSIHREVSIEGASDTFRKLWDMLALGERVDVTFGRRH